jgi:hypothetical protein
MPTDEVINSILKNTEVAYIVTCDVCKGEFIYHGKTAKEAIKNAYKLGFRLIERRKRKQVCCLFCIREHGYKPLE